MSRLLLLLITSSATLLVFGLWIPFKALVAQELLEMAWADTWPVARLSIPELGDSMIVLAGVHGESLAFGPGQIMDADAPEGTVMIAGHRDTHFRPLQHLKPGSELRLQSRDGDWQSYRVHETRVVDSRSEFIQTRQLQAGTLLLITCYPFDSVDANGPLRYVVEARARGTVSSALSGQRLLSHALSPEIGAVTEL